MRQAELYQQAQHELQERKRSAEALGDSEERFRQLAENIDAVFSITEVCENRVSYVSPAYERLWGLNAQELYEEQQSWVDRIHPEDRESTDKAFAQKAVAGQFDEEYRIILPDGSVRWVRDRCFGLQDETGKIYRFAGIAEDISDRQQTEEALGENEQVLRLALAAGGPGGNSLSIQKMYPSWLKSGMKRYNKALPMKPKVGCDGQMAHIALAAPGNSPTE